MLTVNQATLIQCGFHEGECIIISAFKRTNGGLPHASNFTFQGHDVIFWQGKEH